MENESESVIIAVGVGIYMVALLAVGYFASRRVHSSVDFVIAGRRLPLWLCTATLFATWFGGGTCLGAAGAAYNEGLLGVIADPFGAALCLFLAGLFYVRMLRRMRLITLADFFRVRFGPMAEFLSAVLTIPPFLAWTGAQFVALGYVMHTLTGIDTTVAIVAGALVVLVYTLMGGMWAVSITDFFQAIILIAGLLILIPSVVSDAGGWAAMQAALPEGHLAVVPENTFVDWTWYVESWLIVGLGSIPSQDLLQRSLGARDERVAQNSAYLAGLLYVVIGAVPVLLGMAARLVLPEIADPEMVLPQLGIKYLSPVGAALFVGALVSAIMSSADSALLAPATVFTENMLKRWKPSITPAQELRATRWALVVAVGVSLAFALWFQNVYKLMIDSMAVGLAALIVPFTAGIYWKRANAPAAVASIVFGLAGWGVALAVQSTYPAALLGAIVSLAALFIVVRATGKKTPAEPLRDMEGRELRYADRLGVLFGRRVAV
ncbi:MAG: sodium:solute symporter family protein [Acidobacteria bacterium]|nr:sodium:solute symporter family protein [Acidobacteriota bacterium]